MKSRASRRAAPVREGMLPGLVGYALRRAQLRAFDGFFALLASEGITPARFSALILIEANPGISQTVLAEALDIARSGVVTLIDTLQDLGLVARDANDRRSYALRLTARGQTRLRRLRDRVEAHERQLCARLSSAERRQLLDLLSRVS